MILLDFESSSSAVYCLLALVTFFLFAYWTECYSGCGIGSVLLSSCRKFLPSSRVCAHIPGLSLPHPLLHRLQHLNFRLHHSSGHSSYQSQYAHLNDPHRRHFSHAYSVKVVNISEVLMVDLAIGRSGTEVTRSGAK